MKPRTKKKRKKHNPWRRKPKFKFYNQGKPFKVTIDQSKTLTQFRQN